MQYVSENIGQFTAKVAGGKANSAAMGLDFDAVAESHVDLFSRLVAYLRGEAEGGEEDFVDHKRACKLDSWLRGEGALRFGQLQSFVQLRESHEQYHRDAEAALAQLHAGSWMAAERVCKRDLAHTLRGVLIALTELKETMRKQSSVALN